MSSRLTGPRRRMLDRILHHEAVNFVVTNRIPRRMLTLFMGWFSRIEHPLVRDVSLAAWRFFSPDLDLSDARTTRFASLHDGFVRELRAGARPIDPSPSVLVSPCDAVVGAHGSLRGVDALQAKDSWYALGDLLADRALAERYRDGSFVTLRLTASMYHHFHAPADGAIDGVTYVSGDTWNVNPPAVRRVPRLFCRNERAVIPMRLDGTTESLVLVPVAAILVASIRLSIVPVHFHLRYAGQERIACAARVAKGDRMGYFEHGSTIIVIATPGLRICDGVRDGERIRMGEALLQRRSRGDDIPPDTCDDRSTGA